MKLNNETLSAYLKTSDMCDKKREYITKSLADMDSSLICILNNWLDDRTLPTYEILGSSLLELMELHNYDLIKTLLFISKILNMPPDKGLYEIELLNNAIQGAE